MTFRALGIVVFGLIVAIGFGEPAGATLTYAQFAPGLRGA